MNDTEQEVPETYRLNFGQKVETKDTPEVETEAFEEEVYEAEEEEEVIEQDAEEETPTEAAEPDDEPSDEDEVEEPEINIEAPAEADDETSVETLTSERDRLDAEIKARKDAEKASVIAQIKTVVDTYQISTEELVEALGGLKMKRKGVRALPKYRDPITGITWSGRGRAPLWIKDKDYSKFLIPEDQRVRPT